MEFRKLLNDEEVLAELGKYMMDNVFNSEGESIKIGELKELLKWIDKSLFKSMLEKGGKHMTYEQFKMRAFERL